LPHKGVLLIGVDQDWAEDFPEYASITLTSVVKNLDKPVFWAMEAVTNGTFTGGPHICNLENGCVSLAPFHDLRIKSRMRSKPSWSSCGRTLLRAR
jgi:basic membrane protein A and related proteins